MKTLTRAVLTLILLAGTAYGLLLINNSRTGTAVTAPDIDRRLEHSIQWLLTNQASLYQQHNPMLWWMLREAGQLSGDQRLQDFAQKYIVSYQLNAYDSPWQILFRPERFRGTTFNAQQIAALPDYNQYLLFSLGCNADMTTWPLITQQHTTDYCQDHRPLAPACVTHQMMGYRFQQRTQCTVLPDINARIKMLQDKIVQQLFYDPRLVDVYMQRVLMLVDSGAAERVPARALQRLMSAQLTDGSWDALEPLVTLGDKVLGFNARSFDLRQQHGNFHITAQAVLLMSYLKARPELLQQINTPK